MTHPLFKNFSQQKADEFDPAYTDQLDKLFEEANLSEDDEDDTSGADRHDTDTSEFKPLGYLHREEAPEVEQKQLPEGASGTNISAKIRRSLLLLITH